jgi:hypothetical protein
MSTGSKTIENLEEVNILDDKDQFLFFQNSTKKTKRVTKGNMANSGGGLRGKFIDAATGNDVGFAATTASANAATALSTANGAQATADGRNRIFYQNTAPTSPAGGYNLINGDLWFDTSTAANYAMYTWNTSLPGANKWQVREIADLSIARINAGKITAGFIGAQVIAINGTDVYNNPVGAGGYIESTSFVLTWPGANFVDVKTYNGSAVNLGKSVASDVVQVKVLQTDGSYKLYRSIADQSKSLSQVGPPNASYWTEITGGSIPTFTVPINSTENATIQNFGFRISSNGFAEFAGGVFRGAVIANEGYFGTTSNAARIDSTGLVIGSAGRIKSSSLTYTSGGWGSGSGFFLGNTGSAYEFFIGDGSKYLRWDGSNLSVSGNIVGGSTVGTSSTDVGLVMNTQFGIRRSVDNATLTMTGGSGNGVYYGAQIDLVGSTFSIGVNGLTGDDGSGTMQLSAGYRTSSTYDGPLDGAIIFRTLREENSQDSGNDGHSGAQRFRIELDGTVRVVYTATAANDTEFGKVLVAEGGKNTNPGRFLVEGTSATKEVQIKDGKIEFSSAVNVYDTNLYRYGANALGTDDDLYIGGAATRYLYFPNGGNIVWANDTNLYRSAADTLKTDDDFIALSVTTTSARRTKKNIKKYKTGLEIIEKLKPVSFERKMDGKNDIGLIAEEVDKVLPFIVKHNDKNEAEGLDYSKLTVVLINAVKELSAEVKELKKKLKDADAN